MVKLSERKHECCVNLVKMAKGNDDIRKGNGSKLSKLFWCKCTTDNFATLPPLSVSFRYHCWHHCLKDIISNRAIANVLATVQSIHMQMVLFFYSHFIVQSVITSE